MSDMAISFVSADNGYSAAASITKSFTCSSGTKRGLLVGIVTAGNLADVSSVTYNGVAAARLAVSGQTVNDLNVFVYCLANPDAGTHDIVVTCNMGVFYIVCAEYDGMSSVGIPDASAIYNSLEGSPNRTSLTTVLDNCWLVGVWGNNGFTMTSEQTERTMYSDKSARLSDSNGAIHPAGTGTLGYTHAQGPSYIPRVIVSLAPDVGGPASAHKFDGLTKSLVSSINGLAIASVGSWNGLS